MLKLSTGLKPNILKSKCEGSFCCLLNNYFSSTWGAVLEQMQLYSTCCFPAAFCPSKAYESCWNKEVDNLTPPSTLLINLKCLGGMQAASLFRQQCQSSDSEWFPLPPRVLQDRILRGWGGLGGYTLMFRFDMRFYLCSTLLATLEGSQYHAHLSHSFSSLTTVGNKPWWNGKRNRDLSYDI